MSTIQVWDRARIAHEEEFGGDRQGAREEPEDGKLCEDEEVLGTNCIAIQDQRQKAVNALETRRQHHDRDETRHVVGTSNG